MLEQISSEDDFQVIGRLAVIFKLTGEEQILEALACQKKERERGRHIFLGEALLECGAITREQLDTLLLAQSFLKTRARDRRLARMLPYWGAECNQELDLAFQNQLEQFKGTKNIQPLAHILATMENMPGSAFPGNHRSQPGQGFMDTLLSRFVFERLMATLLTDFLNAEGDEIDLSIDRALETIGGFANADRGFVFLISEDGRQIDNTHEWCSQRVSPQKPHWQKLPTTAFPTWMKKLNRLESIILPYADAGSFGTEDEIRFLSSRGVESLVLEPIACAESLIGFVGMESVLEPKDWSEEIPTILEVAAGIFSTALEKRQVQTALKSSKKRYRTLIEAIQDTIFTLDQQGRFTYVNTVMEKTTEYRTDQLLGHHFTKVLSPPYIPIALERFEQGQAGERVPLFEVELLCSNGFRVAVELNLATILDADGQPAGRLGVARDITERKQSENALRKSKARLRHIYENAPIIMHSIDENGFIRDVNRKWTEETGYEKHEVIGRRCDFLLADEAAGNELGEHLARMWSTGSIRDVPSRYVKKDGSLMDVLLNGAAAEDVFGLKTSIITVRDVTESNRIQKRMARRLEYEKTIADISSHFVGVQEIDQAIDVALAGMKKYLSATAVFLYLPSHDTERVYCIHDLPSDRVGAGREKLTDLSSLGHLLNDPSFQQGEPLVISDIHQMSDDALRQFMAVREVQSLLLQPVIIRRKVIGFLGAMILSKSHRWSPSESELLGLSSVLIANAFDIKETEQKTQRAYQELDSIYRSSLGGLRVVDNDFNVIQINDSLAKMIDMPREQAIYSKCFEILPGPHCHTEQCTLARIKRNEVLKGEEVVKRSATDRELIVLSSAAPFYDSEGKLVGMVQDLHDVTDRKRFESIAEAVDSMNNIGYIFSGIRHEIGNPINSIKMTLNVLRNNIDNFPQEKILKYIDRANCQIFKMESLLKSLKSFSMFEKPFIQQVSPAAFVDDLIDLVKEDFSLRNIEVSSTITPKADLVQVDPHALQQILLNVLTNASDALEGRASPKIIFSFQKIGQLGRLSIEDNGRGMSEMEKQSLFKPFCTSKPHGTGLGLVIAKKMLAAMECAISIQSREGLGTTVSIYIPVEKNHGQ